MYTHAHSNMREKAIPVLMHTVKLLEASTCCRTHISFRKEPRNLRFTVMRE